MFENNSIEKIEKKIIELLKGDVFVFCVFDADVSRRSDAEKYAEKYAEKDSCCKIYKAIAKVGEQIK